MVGSAGERCYIVNQHHRQRSKHSFGVNQSGLFVHMDSYQKVPDIPPINVLFTISMFPFMCIEIIYSLIRKASI